MVQCKLLQKAIGSLQPWTHSFSSLSILVIYFFLSSSAFLLRVCFRSFFYFFSFVFSVHFIICFLLVFILFSTLITLVNFESHLSNLGAQNAL